MKTTRVKMRFGDTFGDFSEPVEPGPKEAQRLYLQYLGVLSDLGAGEKAKELRSRLILDEEFQMNAADILLVNMQGPAWIDAFFRSAANRALEEQERRSNLAYTDNTSFGMF